MLGVEYTRDTTAGTILRYNCFSSFTYSTHFYIFRHPQSHRLNSGNSMRASGSSECLTFQFSWLFSFSGIWNLLPCCVSIILICQTIIAYFVSTWIILWIFIYFKSFIDFVLDIMRSCYIYWFLGSDLIPRNPWHVTLLGYKYNEIHWCMLGDVYRIYCSLHPVHYIWSRASILLKNKIFSWNQFIYSVYFCIFLNSSAYRN